MEALEELSCWKRWQTLCALGRLEPAEQELLSSRIAERFRSRLQRLKAHRVWGACVTKMPDDRECAHALEIYCALHQRRDGKSYKHWLLSRGRQDLDTVQSGVMLLLRNVVKEWIRDHAPPPGAHSLQEWLGGEDFSLEDCLPSETGSDVLIELQAWASSVLPEWMEELSSEESASLWVRAKGWVLSDPRAVKLTGFSKTTLHKYHRLLLHRWAGALKEHFPDAPAEAAASVVLSQLDHAGQNLCAMITEKDALAAFEGVESQHA
jgi:hypothetical protein